jgi:RNA polymerase sigma factor (sigma-70 family)
MLETGAKVRWQLTPEAFEKMLAALAPARDAAGEKYLLLRRNLVRYFEGRGFYESEDHADEVFNRVARKLDDGDRIENVSQYVYGVARLLLLELYKKREKENRAVNELPTASFPQAETDEREESESKLRCLNKCLLELPAENRDIIVGYYQGEKRDKIENRQRLAESLGIPQNALRSRAVRLREKLEECILNCLKRRN